jgi:ATP-dependent RNA helicase SUPV3L1/SUV3
MFNIFSKKFDGFQKRRLTVSEILQIAGRAGRYSFNHTNGLVTCLLHNKVDDVVFLKSALNRKPAVLNQAGILPSAEMLECIEKKFPDVPFSGLLTLAEHSAILDGQYFMCDLKDMKRIAEATDE